ncbi:MAG TPA: TIR domain-containing protein [Steroidobacteraceae bacterium]|nr:TIR domain-containing protein [Steroidobacteraceae bacterium]
MTRAGAPAGAVFLSYASQDADAARRICEALRAAGLEVWFDQSELRGGEAWDREITRQIRECALFLAVISEHTEERSEGYFRREWRVAVERMRDMADDQTFLVPVVIDATREPTARVPDRFREFQWLRLPGGETSPDAAGRIKQLLARDGSGTRPDAALDRGVRVRDAGADADHPGGGNRGRSAADGDRDGARDGSARERGPKRGSGWSRGALLILALLVIGVAYRQVRQSGASHASAGAEAADKSIAVLPFVDMSEKHDQQYFSDGLAEELLDRLAQTQGLRVIARSSSFSFKDTKDDLPTIASKLKVANILEGSVRKSGNRVRVTTELVRANDGEQVWSETYDRNLTDILAIQDEIAQAVVTALKVRLMSGAQAPAVRRTPNAEAYNEYLAGRQLSSSSDLESHQKAAEDFRRAVALDEGFAGAYAGLSRELRWLGDHTSDKSRFAAAHSAAETAIQLAPGEYEGYVARGELRYYIEWDWAGAAADLERALAIAPQAAEVYLIRGDLQGTLGRVSEAIGSLKKAIDLDPLRVSAWTELAYLYEADGDTALAIETAQHAIKLQPGRYESLVLLGEIQLRAGQPQAALATFNGIRAGETYGYGVGWRIFGVGLAAYTLGHDDESKRALEEMIQDSQDNAAYQIAMLYAWRGELDPAFKWLDHAYEVRDAALTDVKTDLVGGRLRKDPRYNALLRKMNLPE